MNAFRRGVRVKVAEAPLEVRQLLEVRQGTPGAGGLDVFDALSTSTHLVATDASGVRGGLRLTTDSPAGLPTDDHDVRSMLPAHARLGACSRLCLHNAGDRLLQGLISMAGYWAHAQGLTHLAVAAPADRTTAYERIGFVGVGDAEPTGRRPMVLDLGATSWEFSDFVRRQDVGLWLDTFERAFFDAGEPIVVGGEVGDEAYLVVDGRAQAVDDAQTPLASFQRGSIFGELALLTDRPRASSVVAAVPTDLMVLRRDRFRTQLHAHPALAEVVMRDLGDRFHDAITGA